jgi:hypothetical protein
MSGCFHEKPAASRLLVSGGDVRIHVECYAGYRGEETPRRFRLGTREVAVAEVVDRWLGPDHRYFKLRGEDGAMYVLRHELQSGAWSLSVFDRRAPT